MINDLNVLTPASYEAISIRSYSTSYMANRELGGTGLRGTLFYHKNLSPTVEPDPDNAGGGKLQLSSRPSLGGFFYPPTVSFLKIRLKSLSEPAR